MRRLVLAAALASAFGSGALHAQTPQMRDIVGMWRIIDTRDGKPRALVRVTTTNGVYQGAIVGSLRGEPADSRCTKCSGALHNAPMRGLPILTDLKRGADGAYESGRIIDPDSGDVYACQARLSDNGRTLLIRAFIGVTALGRSLRWERTDADVISQ